MFRDDSDWMSESLIDPQMSNGVLLMSPGIQKPLSPLAVSVADGPHLFTLLVANWHVWGNKTIYNFTNYGVYYINCHLYWPLPRQQYLAPPPSNTEQGGHMTRKYNCEQSQ